MMNTLRTAAALLALAVSAAGLAQQPSTDRLGDHPAIVVQRLYAQQGYDYPSKFYPHPAWLYLLADAPRPMSDHPAVIVFKREQQRQEALGKAPLPATLPATASASVQH
jgi:hypothetical protein